MNMLIFNLKMKQRPLVNGYSCTSDGSYCYTVGEYIILYHKQRESLKKKSEQKDHFITQLIGEKETLQVRMPVYCCIAATGALECAITS